MTDIKKVDTSKYNKEGKVDVDGNIWSVRLPGAGAELKLSKAQRRMKFLQKKIDSGECDESDLDRLDELEQYTYDFFTSIFTDDTDDNNQVKEWIGSTPLSIIAQAFEDIKDQANS